MLWKLNAAFPSVIWQVYDWYLEPNAGYYFMQNACEPVHIQLNMIDYNVTVINRTYHPVSNLTVQAEVFGMDSKSLFHKTAIVNLTESDVQEPFSLKEILADAKGVNFVVLNLTDAGGKVVSHNVYWLAADNNYNALSNMLHTNLETTILNKQTGETEKSWTLKFTNNANILAFFVRPQLLNDGEDVLPCFWSANYFSLAPKESITVTLTVPAAQLKSENQEIKITGWNLDEQRILLK
jgi:hypothetical protein